MMIPDPSQPTRRRVVAGLAALAAVRPIRRVQANNGPIAITLKQGAAGAVFDPPFPAQPGDRLWISLTNAFATPVALGTLGLDGAPAVQRLLEPPLEPGQTRLIDKPLAAPGTFAFEAKSIDDGPGQPGAIAAFTVAEPSPPQVDQDRTLLIEQVFGDGSRGAQAAYTVNGRPSFTLQLAGRERARLRLINGCPRNAIGLRFDELDLQVIAIDSRPAEPFLARDRRILLAPGGRVDALIDATGSPGSTSSVRLFDGGAPREIGQVSYTDAPPLRPQFLPAPTPLPDLPMRLELSNALRAQLDLDGADWRLPKDILADRRTPLFRSKRGRTVLLTLKNPTPQPTTFHLYGHHFRWLDRLDDGWKPFVLDTMLVDAGQTERVAFRADFSGDWLIENAPMNLSAPRRAHWFAVE